MALPVIKAKSYNYGSYANPQQVRFRKGIGAQIGDEFGAGLVEGMQEKRAEKKRQKKEDERFDKNVENFNVKANMQAYRIMGDKARLDDNFRKEIAVAIDDLSPAKGDTVEQKIEKARGLEDLFTNLRGMSNIEKSEVDYDSPAIASGSKADAINGKMASEGYYEGRYNSETKQMEIYIPEVQPYQPGLKFPVVSKKRIDVPTFAERISSLDVTYDPRADLAGLDINSKTVASLYNQRKKEYSGFTSEDLQPDGSKDIYFDKALIKNKFLEDGSEMGMYIDSVVDKKGRTIWEDTLNKGVFDKNNPEHIAQVKDKLADDIANEYSKYRVGSIKPVVKDANLTSAQRNQQEIKDDADYFANQLSSSLINYDKSNDITALQDFFKGKNYDGKEIIGFTMGPQQGKYVIGLEYKSGQTAVDTTQEIDLSNKVEFDNLIDQMFPGTSNYNAGMRRALKNMTFFQNPQSKEDLLNPNK